MYVLAVALCVFLVIEVAVYTYLVYKIRKRFSNVMRYSEYITIALINYTTVVELLDQYLILKQKNLSHTLEQALIKDINLYYLKARENVKIALKYYNPDNIDLDEIVKPLTFFKEQS